MSLPGQQPVGQVSPWNLANVVTVCRLALVPVFVVTLFAGGGHDAMWRGIATAVFVLASLTDRLDGDLARRRGTVTDFGKIADPIADKALTGAALMGLSLLGELPWWITVVIMGRELGITLLRFWALRFGVIAASRGGKIKTVLQVVAIGLYLLPLPEPVATIELLRWSVMGAAILVTVATAVDYIVRAVRLRTAPAG